MVTTLRQASCDELAGYAFCVTFAGRQCDGGRPKSLHCAMGEVLLACYRKTDPSVMKVSEPFGKETLDDNETKEATHAGAGCS